MAVLNTVIVVFFLSSHTPSSFYIYRIALNNLENNQNRSDKLLQRASGVECDTPALEAGT